jgi:glycosyltransferase involved in cell wall biosynthesis
VTAVHRDRPKLLHITTRPESLTFLQGQPRFFRSRGFDVHALSSPGPALGRFAAVEDIRTSTVQMYQTITPLRDLRILFRLWRTVRALRPTIVQAHMTKAGLLGMLAARAAGVPVCIYHNHGMACFSSRGLTRLLLRACERTACALAHRVFTVSPSVRQHAIAERLCDARKLKVLCNGTPNGLDARSRFSPDRYGSSCRTAMRSRLGIPDEDFTLGFVGRILRIKGIDELIRAWQILREDPRFHLLIVGAFDERDPVSDRTRAILRADPRIHMTGLVEDTAPLYAAIDVLVLPSHHEGFPLVALEASAMEIPVVASRVPGCIDAVRDGVTGTLIPPRNPRAITEAVLRYARDPGLSKEHGRAGRTRVLQEFQAEDIWEALNQEYRELLEMSEPAGAADAQGARRVRR